MVFLDFSIICQGEGISVGVYGKMSENLAHVSYKRRFEFCSQYEIMSDGKINLVHKSLSVPSMNI
jgi:hypothetical protein